MARQFQDYYKVLEVDPQAEPEVIQAAYRRLARQYHPDINKSPDAPRRMQEINAAYKVLCNPLSRARYDRERVSYLSLVGERHQQEAPYRHTEYPGRHAAPAGTDQRRAEYERPQRERRAEAQRPPEYERKHQDGAKSTREVANTKRRLTLVVWPLLALWGIGILVLAQHNGMPVKTQWTGMVEPTVTYRPATDIPISSFPLTSGRILFSVYDVLYQMNLDGSDLEFIRRGIVPVSDLAVDLTNNKLYLSRWDARAQVSVSELQNPGNIRMFSDGPNSGGQGLAIDPSGSRIYLGLYAFGVYARDTNPGGKWTRLVRSADLSPSQGQRGQLQIDPVHRHIYFRTTLDRDCSLCRYIWRVNFDGTNLIKIILANGGDALALDLTEQKMYFSDVPGNYTIKRANLDGSGAETVLAVPPPYRFCGSVVLDVRHKKMYLSLYDEDNSFKGRAIARANMDGSGFEILHQVTSSAGKDVSGAIALYLP